MRLLAQVLAALEAASVSHALIGAGAMAVHGVSRATLDLDLLTTDTSVFDPRRWEELRRGGVDVEVRRGDIEDPLAGVVRLRAAGERSVDIIVGRHPWQQDIVERAERLLGGEVLVPVVRAGDLILLKLFAGGLQDAWDVEQLLAAGDREALLAEVEERLTELPPECEALWRKIRSR
ncbi:MAG TPA: hypothetical protein VGB47_00380 [Thermoanaerobaculia bacterium]